MIEAALTWYSMAVAAMAKEVGAVVGRTRGWLVVGMVAAVVGIALWWSAPATQGGAPGGKAHVAPLSAAANARANGTETHPSQGRLAEASRVRSFKELKQRAEAGDAVAQRLLAETYADCLFVNLERDEFLSGVEDRKRLLSDAAHVRVLEQAARERIGKCDAVDVADVPRLELAAQWFAKAAENGDLAARATVRASNLDRQDPAETAQFLEEVLASGDPAAVFMFGGTLREDAPAGKDGPSEPLSTGELASRAWMVAACRMGHECGASGRVMESICLEMSGCAGEDLVTYVQRQLPDEAQREELERRVGEILALTGGR